MQKIDELAKEFLYPATDNRRYLHCIQNLNGHIVATDAYALLAAPAKYFSGSYHYVDSYIDYTKAIPPHSKTDVIFSISVADIKAQYDAMQKADVFKTTDCSTCDGAGSVVCPCCDYEHDCDDCSGEGYVKKTKVGEKVDVEKDVFGIGDTMLHPEYMLLLAKLADAIGSEHINCCHLHATKAAVFYVHDAIVLILPKTYLQESKVHQLATCNSQ